MQRKEGNMREFSYSVICQEQTAAILEYGIVCRDSAGKIVETIEAISPDRTFVSKLAALLNEGQAQACHFWDIVEDALC